MIRVYLIDDHELVRTGFRLVLSQQTDIVVCGEAGTGEDALAALRDVKPDVVLCDLHLPGISGLEVTERIVRGGWQMRVIVVSVQEDGPMPRRLLEAGASGYLSKGAPASELLRAIRDVARGKRYLGVSIAQQLAFGSLAAESSPFDALSPREIEVAMMLVQGLRMAEIGKRLNLSAKTIATHKYNLFEKLGHDSVAALTKLALQHGLIETGNA
ncbi:response regulator [Chiayiivirga flava]|uniref:DNA-binding NarL/FixJ family response regulator n=1 Tax=Chiayiivirga flava TaxID=659595 RepID=A0A7W8D651_9GAMM|nr:response regulator [Chiayiivirga flava]MBB5208600.1 DNA-binding NarL/FixJ family response regulator [Chiayiivirga flava]